MAFGMMMWSLTLIMAKPSSSPWRASVARLSGVASGPRVGSSKPNFIVVPPLISPLLSMPFVVIDQPISRAVVAVHRFSAIELAQAGMREFLAHFVLGLALHQRFRLGKDIRQQNGVMLPD